MQYVPSSLSFNIMIYPTYLGHVSVATIQPHHFIGEIVISNNYEVVRNKFHLSKTMI